MAKKRTAPKRKNSSDANPVPSSVPMAAPASGVTIRMYRQGHGDCFLLAFRCDDGKPFYMLIDCGMKKGSALDCTIKQVAEDIRVSTGGRIHLAVVTHEHEDHVSGFLSQKSVFETLQIDKLWLGWTEDPASDLANQLRVKYKDVLLGLSAASDRLGALARSDDAHKRAHGVVNALLDFELSDSDRNELADVNRATAAGAKIKGRTNKEGILILKKRADQRGGTEYLRPHTKPQSLANVAGVRIFVLGPPENEASLKDMDPQGEEEFHFAAAEERAFFAAVAGDNVDHEMHQPFSPRHRISIAAANFHKDNQFFEDRYRRAEAWRRIDGDWLRSSEQFALRMNTYINNTSLAFAIELPRSKKVLLFVGDAQRGNWVSWHTKKWNTENGLGVGEEITALDLLARTVFYKVGHHGSHNATMNKGGLREMARGPFADEFVAMIPANEDWALSKNDPPWRHPLKEILAAVTKKARGRVFVMDRATAKPERALLSAAEWKAFRNASAMNKLYYEFTVND